MVSHIRESNIELHGSVNAREHMTKKSRAHEIDQIGQDHISDNYTSSVLKKGSALSLSHVQSHVVSMNSSIFIRTTRSITIFDVPNPACINAFQISLLFRIRLDFYSQPYPCSFHRGYVSLRIRNTE